VDEFTRSKDIPYQVKEEEVQVRSNDLEDMVVLVVGCGTPGSIGSAIAQALADAGAALVLADLATSKLVAVGQQLVEQGHRVLTQAVDLVSENSVEELVSFAQKSFGRLDAVVNGCGRNQPSRSSSYDAPAVR
jgi:NAD(P)-dependent dehydrogenase (short-subunit alcohol dehydrogenase family)